MRVSLPLLPPFQEQISLTGDPVRGAGWYGPNTGLHSISITVLNFTGRVSIQASLAAVPGNNDWFSVLPNGVAYWQYPRASFVIQQPSQGETSTLGFNFSSNVIWVRASVDRAYLISDSSPISLASFGTIDSILLNY